MSNFSEQLPKWDNTGSEPNEAKKTSGWQVGEKPPAGWLNWLFNKAYACLVEIRSFIDSFKETVDIDIESLQNEVQNSLPPIPISLSTESPVVSVDVPVNGGINFEMEASPLLVNLLGRIGYFEKDSNSDGIADGWGPVSATSYSVSGNAQNFTPIVQYGGVKTAAALSVISGHKYYFVGKLSTTDNTARIYVMYFNGANSATPAHSGSGNFEKLSVILTALSDHSTAVLQPQTLKTSGFVAVSAKEMMAVDLTAMFGAGNEPSQAWCDANLSYVNDIQPMMGLYLQSSGKNLFDINNPRYKVMPGFIEVPTGSFRTAVADTKSIILFAQAGKQYTLTRVGGDRNVYGFFDKVPNADNIPSLAYGQGYTTSVAPAGTKYLVYYVANAGTAFPTQIQLEEGSTATTYEPYQGSATLIEGEFAGIGSYRDRLSYRNGVAKKLAKVKKYVLQASDITNYYTGNTNIDWIDLKKPIGYLHYNISTFNAGLSNSIVIPGFRTGTHADNVANIGQVFNNGAVSLGLIVAKGTYANLTAAQAALAGTVIWYVLAAPVEEILPTPINGLSVYKGKTTMSLQTGVVKERANVGIRSDSILYYINISNNVAGGYPSKQQTYKIKQMQNILKNKVPDSNWTIRYDNPTVAYGIGYATIEAAKYDNAATYEIVYEVLHEEYNNQQASITVKIQQNLLDSHNELVKTASEVQRTVAAIKDDVVAKSHIAEVVAQVIISTRDAALTGTQTISVASGRTPKSVTVLAVVQNSKKQSIGISDGTHATVYSFGDTGNFGSSASAEIAIADTIANRTFGALTLKSGSFDIVWSQTGTGGTGTIQLHFLVQYHD